MTALAHHPTDLSDLTPGLAPHLVAAPEPHILEVARAERLTAAQQRRAAARTRDLTALLRDRPDLAGVHAPADFAVEAVRWCA